MRSLKMLTLLGKEGRELLASRSYWFLLLLIGPLVGHDFVTALVLYGEASGSGVRPAALPQGLSPLDGILVPTLGAYYIAVTLLFPFVAIRLVSNEKETGAVKLAAQFPVGMGANIAAKVVVLLAGWAVAWVPGVIAIVSWRFCGGHLQAPETLNLVFGHLLHMLLASGVAVAAAAIAESAASAAIVTLGFTLGTWALDFIAAGRGGWIGELAAYTPTAALRGFEQGVLGLSSVVVISALSLGGFVLAAIWMHPGRSWRRRGLLTAATVLGLGLAVIGGAILRPSWDLSEDRRNSFPQADEMALGQIRNSLRVTVHLSPEDPRLMDLQRNVLAKLERILPRVEVQYSAGSVTGLFEGGGDQYGEVWYEIAGRRAMTRSTVEPIVLEQIYQLADVNPPEHSSENGYPGYPLAVNSSAFGWTYYGGWPLTIILAAVIYRKARR